MKKNIIQFANEYIKDGWNCDSFCDECGKTIRLTTNSAASLDEPNTEEKDYCKDCCNNLFPEKVKEDFYEYFAHMQNEENNGGLGGMAWDDICWQIHSAVEFGITQEQLAKDFPSLLGHIVKKPDARRLYGERN